MSYMLECTHDILSRMLTDRSEAQFGDPHVQATLELVSTSGRIILRQFTVRDVQDIFELIDTNRAWLSQNGDRTADKYQTAEDVFESIARPANPSRLRFAIRTVTGMLVGSINLTPDSDNPYRGEVGYYLGEEGTGHGYATEAVVTLSAYAFGALGYDELYAKVVPENEPSGRVLVRAGYVERGEENGQKVFVQEKVREGK